MPRNTEGPSRKEQILLALAQMLEEKPGGLITTAALAAKVGVSEAALYRHFPSKAKMFEGLINFIEDTLFSRINRITRETQPAGEQCEKILLLVLTFAEKNPGISRILNGDALSGETERLRQRVNQIFEKLDTQLKQLFRESEVRSGTRTNITVTATAALLTGIVEGKIAQFIRSDFKRLPTTDWQDQWRVLEKSVITSAG
jgi:TetR/AcrR family transcriptional regulator